MVANISDMYSKLKLTEEEGDKMNLQDVQDHDRDRLLDLFLVGHVLSSKPILIQAMKIILIRAWKLSNHFSINKIEGGFFWVQFQAIRDK